MEARLEEFARRAVRAAAWKWLPGMRALNMRYRSSAIADAADCWRWNDARASTVAILDVTETARWNRNGPPSVDDWIPDLSDPCTLGGLLALVRAAWASRPEPCGTLAAFMVNGKWCAGCMSRGTLVAVVLPACDSEAEALVAALEVAPVSVEHDGPARRRP